MKQAMLTVLQYQIERKGCAEEEEDGSFGYQEGRKEEEVDCEVDCFGSYSMNKHPSGIAMGLPGIWQGNHDALKAFGWRLRLRSWHVWRLAVTILHGDSGYMSQNPRRFCGEEKSKR